VGLLNNALKENFYGSAVTAFRLKLKKEGTENPAREIAIIKELQVRLQGLRLTSAGCYPMNGSLKITGPGMVRATHLNFGVAVQLLPKDLLLIQLLPGEFVELDILVEWGKGELSVSERENKKIPRDWVQLNCNHSPVRQIRTKLVEVTSEALSIIQQVIAEIETDGSITPQDAVRKVSFKLPSRTNH
jgi:DNA-directed RNA polymerase subunit alpha